MPTLVPATNHELRSPGFISGGLAGTTTVKTVGLPPGTKNVSIHTHNLSTATVAQFAINPWLTVLKTTDGGATFTDYSEVAQDDSSTDSIALASLDTLANGDALFIGSHVPFRGVQADLDDKNDTASVLTISYYNDTTWVDTSNTDGTDSGGDTLKQDGANTWTINSAWVAATLEDIFGKANDAFGPTFVKPAAGIRIYSTPLYWTRWEVSAAIDSSVSAISLHALNRSVSYAQVSTTHTHVQAIHRGLGGAGSIEYRTDAGTADVNITAGSGAGYFG
jgi:hypothetical protein